jgi:hypothetical protein
VLVIASDALTPEKIGNSSEPSPCGGCGSSGVFSLGSRAGTESAWGTVRDATGTEIEQAGQACKIRTATRVNPMGSCVDPIVDKAENGMEWDQTRTARVLFMRKLRRALSSDVRPTVRARGEKCRVRNHGMQARKNC